MEVITKLVHFQKVSKASASAFKSKASASAFKRYQRLVLSLAKARLYHTVT